MSNVILLVSCPDKRGITSAITTFVYENNGNIIHADQHIDEQSNTFFMRIEWSLEGFAIKREEIKNRFVNVASRFDMDWTLNFTDKQYNVALFVSGHLHCLYDLLYRFRAGQFKCNIPVIISNHSKARAAAEEFGIKFYEIPVNKDNKEQQEQKQIEILEKEKVDLIVLARYHQILTAGFVAKYENRIINIHHSFLPAFIGKSPYAQAYRKGVKIIGATSHYVTEHLDEGPIIEQDTVRISHRDALEDLVIKGEDLEKVVLSRAVRWHLERKILKLNNKTVIFD
ncbi:MAG: formyltetrahydrofolate deformylase [Omnitrophica WOR_2 bacterium GWF2_38_59]|nr:MAG: formyltetrahydrofolate deformylase [Omnitrophica WOR_2 bacterium GWF2_38_59]OGX48941.1 MAG: formyltetrahydrofolate deformylase [Omnitrophica WOR_2 bacterium RIFOXYA2_FULL_38_17]OGX52841.1 MAG: formyltetrahydrofolate deformylase [Omnitrophica WOR_2 bacterium RIFOXYA12_FULL_38_10]OGX57538.1 MAG: formyltetrahydrofolate deformylase [Omnitrophica WOR_2 bacterium RIFOXYB2_FULL_38_16]HBG61344.1 formyltetrahydrofolate deformylase [Candidatus Omnitrophota bacterium]